MEMTMEKKIKMENEEITQEFNKSTAIMLVQQSLLVEISHTFNVYTDPSFFDPVPITINAPTQVQAKQILLKSLKDTLISFLKNDGYYKKGDNYKKIFSFKFEWDGYSMYGVADVVADLKEIASGDLHVIRYINLLKSLLDLIFDSISCNNYTSQIDYDNIDIMRILQHQLIFMESVEFDTIEDYFIISTKII
jgi:hypothetical protein